MSTKRTDQLRPGDRVRDRFGVQIIRDVGPTDANPKHGALLVRYQPQCCSWGRYVNPEDAWEVVVDSPPQAES
jgi:hypothetical protein